MRRGRTKEGLFSEVRNCGESKREMGARSGKIKGEKPNIIGEMALKILFGTRELGAFIILNRYEADATGWGCNQILPSSHSLYWKHILQVGPLFYPHTHI